MGLYEDAVPYVVSVAYYQWRERAKLEGRAAVAHVGCFVFCVLCFVFCVLCFVFCVLCFVFCVLCFVFCVVFKRTLSYQLGRKSISAKAKCTTFVQK